MTGRAGRTALRRLGLAASCGLLLAAAVAGLLAWRLAQGPIPLDFLKPRLEAALGRPGGGFSVEIGAIDVAWAGWERGLDLRAERVAAVASDGRVIASLPTLAVELSVGALLRGSIALTSIEALDPSLRLVRHPDGAIDLGLGDSATPAGDPVLSTTLSDLLGARDGGGGVASHLEQIAITRGRIRLDDLESGEVWRAPRLDVTLERDDGGIAAALAGELELGGEPIAMSGNGRWRRESAGAELRLAASGIRPAAIVARARATPGSPIARYLGGALPALERLDLVLDANVEVALDPTWRPARTSLRLHAAGGSVSLPPGEPLPVKSLALDLAFDEAAGRLDLERLALDLVGPTLTATGRLAGLAGPGRLTAECAAAGLPIELAWRLWPAGTAEAARAWLTANLSQGTIETARVELAGDVAGGDPATLAGVSVSGSVTYDGLSVRYLETMPRVTGVKGGGTFTQQGFALRVEAGSLEGIAVGPGSVAITGIDGPASRIAIEAGVQGPIGATLRVLDDPPLGIARAIDIRPEQASGSVSGRVSFAFPLGGDLGLASLGFSADAELSDVAVANAIAGWSVANGSLTLAAGARAVDLHGDVALAGVPLAVAWHEDLRPAPEVRRTVTAKGAIDAAGRRALGFDLEPWLAGPVGTDLRLTQPSARPARIDLSFDLAPATIDVAELDWKKEAGAPGRAAAELTLVAGDVTAVDRFSLEAGGMTASGSAARPPGAPRWKSVEVSATLAGRQPGELPGNASISLDGQEQGYGFRITSNDSSTLFHALGLQLESTGGRLVFAGTATGGASAAGPGVAGRLEIADLNITRAPPLAQVAKLASLRGVADAFSGGGGGIHFDRVTADIARQHQVLSIRNGLLASRTLGLSIDGTIDQASGTTSLRGTLVPELWGLNRALRSVPVVGWVIGGNRQGGAVGVDFSIEGPIKDPQVSVRPLDSITPGIVRSLLDLVEGDKSAAKKP